MSPNVAPIRIPLVWSTARRLKRGFLLTCAALSIIVLLTLPMLWLDAVLWLISLAFGLCILVVSMSKMLSRLENADISTNGPFITIDAGEILFPDCVNTDGAVPESTRLADLQFTAWRNSNVAFIDVGKGVRSRVSRETAYLALSGNNLNVVLAADNGTATIAKLPTVSASEHDARLSGKPLIRVDTMALLRAEMLLVNLRDRATLTTPTPVPPPATQSQPKTTSPRKPHQVSSEDEARRARRHAQLEEALRAASANKAGPAPTPPATPAPLIQDEGVRRRLALREEAAARSAARDAAPTSRDNIQERLFSGKLKEVPAELIPYVREWRDGLGRTLLHLPGSNRAISALLAAGLDPSTLDKRGHTALMVPDRTALANKLLLDAGTPLMAVSVDGSNAVACQALPHVGQSIGYARPDFAAIELLIAAGLPAPTWAEAESWKKQTESLISSGGESNDWKHFCDWLDDIAQDN